MTDAKRSPSEAHVNVWRFGSCIHCGAADSWVIIAVPKLATGEQFPQFGKCEACGYQVDLAGSPPFVPGQPVSIESHTRDAKRSPGEA